MYRHLALINQNGIHPLFLGPSLILHRKLYSSYKHLPKVLGNIDQARKKKEFGTDDEVNLNTALKDEWVEADHMSCFIHMRQNIERKLRELWIKGGEVTKMLKKKFWMLNLPKILKRDCNLWRFFGTREIAMNPEKVNLFSTTG